MSEDSGSHIQVAASASTTPSFRRFFAGQLVDVTGILVVGTLLALGRMSETTGVALLVAIIAGRLRPAQGSSVITFLPFLLPMVNWIIGRHHS